MWTSSPPRRLVDDQLWALLAPLILARRPGRGPGRRPRVDDRQPVEGTIFVLTTGVRGAQLPPQLGFGSRWTAAGVAGRRRGRPAAPRRAGRPGPAADPGLVAGIAGQRQRPSDKGGPADRAEADRPREARVKLPPAGRHHRPADRRCGLGCPPARLAVGRPGAGPNRQGEPPRPRTTSPPSGQAAR